MSGLLSAQVLVVLGVSAGDVLEMSGEMSGSSGIAGAASRGAGARTGAMAGLIDPEKMANRTASVSAGNAGRRGAAGGGG